MSIVKALNELDILLYKLIEFKIFDLLIYKIAAWLIGTCWTW